MPHLHANGIDQYYEVHGEGQPLVLVAGMGGTANYWGDQVPALRERFRVVCYDQRGTGRTTHTPVASLDQLADDLLALLDALGIERFDCLAHSTGGNIAQILALEHAERIRRLVIYASTTHGDAYRTKVWRVRRAILEKLGPELYADMSSLQLYPPWWIAQNAEKLEAQQAGQAAMLPPADVMASRIEAVQAFDRRADLARIATPTLVVCARDDSQTPLYFSEYLASHIPGARLAVMEGGAHVCSRIYPDAFNDLVLDFLNE